MFLLLLLRVILHYVVVKHHLIVAIRQVILFAIHVVVDYNVITSFAGQRL